MRAVSILLILAGGAALLVPGARGLLPFGFHLGNAAWQWLAFGSIAMAVMVYFLAPKN